VTYEGKFQIAFLDLGPDVLMLYSSPNGN